MELTKAMIEGAQDLTRECVEVPEWGGEVYISVMTGSDRDSLESSCHPDKDTYDPSNFRGKVLVRTMVSSAGVKLFVDGDAPAIGAKSNVALERLFEVSMRLNSLSTKAVEDVAKNSPSGQSAASGSSSATGTGDQSQSSSEPSTQPTSPS